MPEKNRALAAEEKTEFQKFVFTDTGVKLPIYGRSLFDGVPATFAPVDRAPVPADYVVGPGDELIIRGWGQIDIDARLTVDRNGQIYLPKVGTINVAGIRYDQLTGYLKNSISRIFRSFDLSVTLGQLRAIQIFVVGQARRPGSYTVSSLSTLVNALFASGGPSINGSMRGIQLRRHGQVVTSFDLYDLLAKGDKSRDQVLLPGDVIYIPPVGKQVAVLGSINLPGIYELGDQTTLAQQLELVGGLTSTADGTRVVLERIENRSTRKVEELKLDDAGLAQTLQDGDIVHIFNISPRVESAVILRGHVANPGRYPWREGMRVSDLIPSKESILTREYWNNQNLLARTSTGWADPLAPSKNSPSDRSPAQQTGSTKDKNSAKEDDRDKERESEEWSDKRIQGVVSAIPQVPSEINWDYAVVQRLNRQDFTTELLAFNLGEAIEDSKSTNNMELLPGDVVTIFSQSDFAIPIEKRTRFISLEGEVKAAGIYRITPGETLRDAVVRAGGLTEDAYLFGAEFRRESTRIDQQKRVERLIQDAEREIQSRAKIIATYTSQEDRAVATAELQAARASLEKLRQIQVTGRIVLELNPGDNAVSAIPAIQLEDGDQLIVPSKLATVGVFGAVYNPNSFVFKNNGNVAQYLSAAGGGTRDADGARLFIIRASGTVVSKQMHRSIWSGSFESTRLFPGDSIVMPEKIRTGNFMKGLKDWTQVFAQLALGAAAINVLR